MSVPAGVSLYSEEDDAVTQMAVAPIREAKWIVQVTCLDRRIMSTEQLLSELARGSMVHARTLVWRGGMNDWTPVAALEELAGLVSGLAHRPAPASSERPRAPSPALLALAACATGALAIGITVFLLRQGGVFGPARAGGAEPAHLERGRGVPGLPSGGSRAVGGATPAASTP